MILLLIPWLILSEKGSPAMAGLVIAIAALPAAAITIGSGALTDRIGARRVSIFSDALSTLSVMLFPIAIWAGALSLPVLIAMATLGAAFDPAGFSARRTLISNVAHTSKVSVPQLNSIHEAVFGAAWVLGPALTGILVLNFGLILPFAIAATMFSVAALVMFMLPVTSSVMGERERRDGLKTELKTGLRALWRNKVLRLITLTIMLMAGIYLPVEGILLPTLYEQRAQPQIFGFVITALGAGSIVGSLLFSPLIKRLSERAIFAGCLAASGVTVLLMSALPAPLLFVGLGVLLGLSWGPMQPLLNTLIQTRIDAPMQGRVFAIQVALFSLAPPLGYLLAGVATQSLGVGNVFLTIALILIAVGAFAIWRVYRLGSEHG